MSTTVLTAKIVAEDNEPLVMQLGSVSLPQDLTGFTGADMILRDLTSNEQLPYSGLSAMQLPLTLGRVERQWQSGERVVGKKYAVECVTTDSQGLERTWPDPDYLQLRVVIVPRRTTPT